MYVKMTRNSVNRFKFYQISQIHYLSTRQICMYIKKLHQIILKQQFYLKKYKKRDKKKKVKEEVNNEIKEPLKKDEEEERDQKVSSFLDEIKSAATEGWIQQMGMVFEPTSGMYYHPTTGYYYNAEYNLYYDGNTGTYLKYNEQTFAYEFYSKVETTAGAQEEKTSDKAKRMERKRGSDSDLDEFGRTRRTQRRRLSSSSERRHLRHRSRERYRRRSRSSSDSDRERQRRRRRSRSRSRGKSSKHRRSPKKSHKRKSRTPSSVEEGELSAGSGTDDTEKGHSKHGSQENETVVEFRHPRKDIAAKYPPSLRLIVQETDLKDKLKTGSLFIIPFTGGSLGREGSHDIIIPDVNVSKTHLRFTYNTDRDRYECIDVGSRNGTILNGTRMSESGVKSKRVVLKHDSVIELNKTKILCHIHEGHTTCDKCEPGIIQKTEEAAVSVSMEVLSHKAALKRLQKRYGLESEKYIEDPKDKSSSSSSTYKDRADTRRKTVGSSHHTEKTVQASVDTSISSDNKGFKMLSKLGWSEGQKLGKSDTGLLEPIPIVSNEGTKGLGCDEPIIGPVLSRRKAQILAKTQQRFAQSGTVTEKEISLIDSDASD